jgi:hypothetical protein
VISRQHQIVAVHQAAGSLALAGVDHNQGRPYLLNCISHAVRKFIQGIMHVFPRL